MLAKFWGKILGYPAAKCKKPFSLERTIYIVCSFFIEKRPLIGYAESSLC